MITEETEKDSNRRKTCQDRCSSLNCMLLRQITFSIIILLEDSGSGASKSPSSVAILQLLLDLEKDVFKKLPLVLDF